MTQAQHGLIVKFNESSIKKEYLKSVSTMANYKETMIDCNLYVVT